LLKVSGKSEEAGDEPIIGGQSWGSRGRRRRTKAGGFASFSETNEDGEVELPGGTTRLGDGGAKRWPALGFRTSCGRRRGEGQRAQEKIGTRE
jgi:hypothetical protein